MFGAPQTPSLSGLEPGPAAQCFEAAKAKRLVVSSFLFCLILAGISSPNFVACMFQCSYVSNQQDSI